MKKNSNSKIIIFYIILFAAVILALSVMFGQNDTDKVTYGDVIDYFKNDQVAVRTEINNINREIALCHLNTNQHRTKASIMTNRWAMRDRLSQDRSTLRDIDRSQIELARRLQDSGMAVIRRR